jgi:hypothetical protein
MSRGAAPIYPTHPRQPRPGDGKLYWINVREDWDPDTFEVTYRLYNHGARAGGRLFKGYGSESRPIRWPFKPGEEWLVHGTKESADTAAEKLQQYLDKIASK